MEKPKALEQLECMENVIESIDLALFAVNTEGTITVWNRAMEREILPKEQAIGKHSERLPSFQRRESGHSLGRCNTEARYGGRKVNKCQKV